MSVRRAARPKRQALGLLLREEESVDRRCEPARPWKIRRRDRRSGRNDQWSPIGLGHDHLRCRWCRVRYASGQGAPSAIHRFSRAISSGESGPLGAASSHPGLGAECVPAGCWPGYLQA